MRDLDVGIIGAGIGGLVAALALHRDGQRVRLYEQASALGEIGAGVMLTPNATRVLEALGLGERLAAIAVTPAFTAVRDHASGAWLSKTPIGDTSMRRHGSPSYYVHRSDLHDLLVAAARANDPDAVQLGHAFTGLVQEENAVVAIFGDGNSVRVQALIGADGIKSRVQRFVVPDAQARFTGNVAWRGLVPAASLRPELRQMESLIWTGPKLHIVCYGVRGHTLINYVAIAEQDAWQSEGWTVRSELSEVLEAFEGWHPDIVDVLRETPKDGCFKWGLFDHDPLPRWSVGRVALLGDAAHPMLPFMAQGAAMSIEDGAVLADVLRRHDDVAAAFQAYEALRMDRTAWVQTQARNNQGLYHDNSAGPRFDEDREMRAKVLYDYDAFAVAVAA